MVKCDQHPRVTNYTFHTEWALNNPWHSGAWFYSMSTTLPGNPARSHHTGYWANGHSIAESTTYSCHHHFSNFRGLEALTNSAQLGTSVWMSSQPRLGRLLAIISIILCFTGSHRFCLIPMIEKLLTLTQNLLNKTQKGKLCYRVQTS